MDVMIFTPGEGFHLLTAAMYQRYSYMLAAGAVWDWDGGGVSGISVADDGQLRSGGQQNNDLPKRVYSEIVASAFLNLEQVSFPLESLFSYRMSLCSGSIMRVSQSPHPANFLCWSSGLVLSSVKRSAGVSLSGKDSGLGPAPSNETGSKQLM